MRCYCDEHKHEMMDIYARQGDKVVFRYPYNGRKGDQELAQQRLQLNKVYTVERTDVSSDSSSVYLIEIPGMPFNIALFEDCRRLT